MKWKNKLDDFIKQYDVGVDDILDYWYEEGLINSPERTKKKVSSFSWEIVAQGVTKKYSTDLKKPNLDIEDKSHLFYNKKVVVTGVFENFGMRKTIAQMIKDVGGDNDTHVTKKTDFIIAGEGAGWKKLEQAKDFGVKVLSEQEFIELFE
ncbi:BRCT domain-containing protein [Polaribacter ponticola]|uniref:BRCT domain-containing protein n=1 Tax=Polaribacter ponticola TaxID=2978475 RepID=A0ABT5S4C7_9FLAO|nr:BRCT domain-containing protein [Polaribacter sp. MSW5]MDD7912967.1 BRCT domain-containing protein [Polaribacter sp. MSW5]MDD7913735.1 BRCT domain-containing protein [Polaribacter sp. MSW5]